MNINLFNQLLQERTLTHEQREEHLAYLKKDFGAVEYRGYYILNSDPLVLSMLPNANYYVPGDVFKVDSYICSDGHIHPSAMPDNFGTDEPTGYFNSFIGAMKAVDLFFSLHFNQNPT